MASVEEEAKEGESQLQYALMRKSKKKRNKVK
jgi:hypothetical protein